MEQIIKTKKRIEREKRNAEIVEKFQKLSAEFPTESRSRIAATIAELFGLTTMAVYNILNKGGVW